MLEIHMRVVDLTIRGIFVGATKLLTPTLYGGASCTPPGVMSQRASKWAESFLVQSSHVNARPRKRMQTTTLSSYHTLRWVTMEKQMLDGNRSCSLGFFDLTAVKWQVMCNHGQYWQGMLAFPWLLNQHLPKSLFLDFAHASLSAHKLGAQGTKPTPLAQSSKYQNRESV